MLSPWCRAKNLDKGVTKMFDAALLVRQKRSTCLIQGSWLGLAARPFTSW